MKKSIFLILAVAISQFINAQDCSDLFFSEYVEGSNNDKAIEIYNPTMTAIDLSNYIVKKYGNGSPVPTAELQLSGIIQPGDVVVVTNGQTDSVWVAGTYWSLPINEELYALGDLHCSGEYPTIMYYNGNDVLTLETISEELIDIFGKVGIDPGSYGWNDIPPTYFAGDEWWTSWTKDQTLIRKSSVKMGAENPEVFMVNMEWDSLPNNTWENLGSHECDCHYVGTTNHKFEHSIKMYPNPSENNTVTISSSEKIVFVSMVNQQGQIVYAEEFISGKDEVIINGEFLTPGIYFVTTKFVDKSDYSDKLIIK